MTDTSGDAIAEYVRAMARGPSRGRGLTQDEARDALSQIMNGSAARLSDQEIEAVASYIQGLYLRAE